VYNCKVDAKNCHKCKEVTKKLELVMQKEEEIFRKIRDRRGTVIHRGDLHIFMAPSSLYQQHRGDLPGVRMQHLEEHQRTKQ
jgi:hypothetical protein